MSNRFTSNCVTTQLNMTGGAIGTLVTPVVYYRDKITTGDGAPVVVCAFTNEGSNFVANKKITPYDVSILSRKPGVGIYEFDIKVNTGLDIDSMQPISTLTNAAAGAWNKRTVVVENWGWNSGYWRIRVITSDAGNGKRTECNVNVVMLAKMKK